MRKTFNFGKIDYNGSGRRINLVTIEVGYKEGEFTASGGIWNASKTDCIHCGQCLGTIAGYVKDPLFQKIFRLWEIYHLNGCHAGTPEQEAAVKEWRKTVKSYGYTAACEHLKSIGLYEVPAEKADLYRKRDETKGKPYQYGHEWLFHPIPEEDIREIESLFAE